MNLNLQNIVDFVVVVDFDQFEMLMKDIEDWMSLVIVYFLVI